MKSQIALYGTGAICQMLRLYNARYDLFDIVALIDDNSDSEEHESELPKMTFKSFCEIYPPVTGIRVLVTIGYTNCNIHRERICKNVRDAGYSFVNFIAPNANVWRDTIRGTNVIVLDNVFVGMGSEIDDGVMIMPGTVLAHDVIVDKYVFFSNAAVVGGNARIGNNSFVGLNSTIKSSVVLGAYNVVGSAANVIHDTPANSVVKGNPGVAVVKDTIHMKI